MELVVGGPACVHAGFVFRVLCVCAGSVRHYDIVTTTHMRLVGLSFLRTAPNSTEVSCPPFSFAEFKISRTVL